MLWMELTSERMTEAVEQSGRLCLLPIGCLERHGPHLPLGTDQIVVDEVARRAAEEEPAVVFPSYYFGQISEARHVPGAIALPHDLLLQLLRATLDEIGRNGFTRILIVNGHGGNSGLLSYLMMALLQESHAYMTYVIFPWNLQGEDAEKLAAMKETEFDGHAGEFETSAIMYVRPELVHMEDLTPPEDGQRRGLQKDLGGLQNPFAWYANFPTQFAGEPRPASAEKGEFVIEAATRATVKAMKAIKADEVTPGLQADFHKMVKDPTKRSQGL
jgi:creatinine amidohydrolase